MKKKAMVLMMSTVFFTTSPVFGMEDSDNRNITPARQDRSSPSQKRPEYFVQNVSLDQLIAMENRGITIKNGQWFSAKDGRHLTYVNGNLEKK